MKMTTKNCEFDPFFLPQRVPFEYIIEYHMIVCVHVTPSTREIIQMDMDIWDSSGQWGFSCYSSFKTSLSGLDQIYIEMHRHRFLLLQWAIFF